MPFILENAYPITSQITYDEQDMPIYDRAVGSEVLRNIILKYFTEGVFQSATDFMVSSADAGMFVSIAPGSGNVRGCTGYTPDGGTLPIEPPGGVARIDNIVLRWDANVDVRRLLVDVVKGPANGNAAEPTRTEDIWECVLARVHVRSTATQILVTDIEDTRLSADLCGIVQVRPNAEDPSPYFVQVQAYIDYLKDVIDGVIDGSQYMLKTAYDNTNTVSEAGGIVPYVDSQLANMPNRTDLANIINGNEHKLYETYWGGRPVYEREVYVTSWKNAGNITYQTDWDVAEFMGTFGGYLQAPTGWQYALGQGVNARDAYVRYNPGTQTLLCGTSLDNSGYFGPIVVRYTKNSDPVDSSKVYRVNIS